MAAPARDRANDARADHVFSAAQARLITLLLRHDEHVFHATLATRDGYTPAPDSLRRVRDLAVLFHLRDDLFDHIVPHIERSLSFAAARLHRVEPLPPRGTVDWERTLEAALEEAPGEPPLHLHTRERRRDFATPENLLLVATLLEYATAARRLLREQRGSSSQSDPLAAALRDMVQRSEQALTFPQFAALRQSARRLLETTMPAGHLAALEAEVHHRLPSGSKGQGYAALLAWRHRLHTLALLAPQAAEDAPATIGADPQAHDSVYRLWLLFELGDMLHAQRRLCGGFPTAAHEDGALVLRFVWGSGEQTAHYELRHAPAGVPAAPDFLLLRVDPPPQQVVHQGVCWWREGGLVCAAGIGGTVARAGSLLRRAAGDMALHHARGALRITALDAPDVSPHHAGSSDMPLPGCWHIAPPGGDDVSIAASHAALRALLDAAHAQLFPPPALRCQGIFLDTLSATDQQQAGLLPPPLSSDNDTPASELLVCPRPHLGAGRAALVSRAHHCCRDPAQCHIIGLPDRRVPVRPPRTADDLLAELQHVFVRDADLAAGEPGGGGDDDEREPDEALLSAIAQQVERITRRFAEIAGAYRQLEVYHHRLRDLGMERSLHLLEEEERTSLALALFLVEQLDSVGAHDYSAPAIHLTSVMERAVQQRPFACPDPPDVEWTPRKRTLGVLPWMRRKPADCGGYWEHMQAYVAQHWHGAIDPHAPDVQVAFEDFVALALSHITQLRNRAAHAHAFSRKEYSDLQRLMLHHGARPLGEGALNVLLLAWREG